MSLKEQILSDLKDSLKSGDNLRRDTLRLLCGAIKNSEIEKMKKEEGLNDQEVVEVLKKAAKQRKDSIEQYERGGRNDLAEKEKNELEIIHAYLPKQLDEKVLREEIRKIILETGADSTKDFGRVMGAVMKKIQGKADGSVVKSILEEELSGKSGA